MTRVITKTPEQDQRGVATDYRSNSRAEVLWPDSRQLDHANGCATHPPMRVVNFSIASRHHDARHNSFRHHDRATGSQFPSIHIEEV